MNEPRPVPPQGSQGQSHGLPHAPTHLPRPAGAGGPALRPPGGGIAPPPAQRLPGQPGHVQPAHPQTVHPVQPAAPAQPARPTPPPLPASRGLDSIPVDGDDELINLDDDDAAAHPPAETSAGTQGAAPAAGLALVGIGQIARGSKIKFHAGGDKHTYTKFKREAHSSLMGATRVRSFHGRLSDDGLAFTDDKINEWLDNHPEVEIKHVNCIVGPLEGKVTGEQGLIVVIWY